MRSHTGGQLFSRRQLMQALGLAGPALLLPDLRSSRLAAAETAIPKRIVFFWTANSQRQLWMPKALPGKPAATEREFDLNPLHEPLRPHKDDLAFVENMDYRSLAFEKMGFANAHIGGALHSLTGANAAGGRDGEAGAISIDQFIAKTINTPVPKTLLPSLDLHGWIRDYSTPNYATPSYLGPKQWVPMEPSPYKAFKRLFPMPNDTAETVAAKMREADKQKAVVDLVSGDFASLRPRLGNIDRERLDVHASAVRDLEKRLGLGGGAACTRPEITLGAKAPPRNAQSYTANVDAQLRLIQAAFACDLTRVATISFNGDDAPSGTFGWQDGMFEPGLDLHGLNHLTTFYNGKLMNNPDAMAMMTKSLQHDAANFAKLLAYLKAVPERDGSRLFDHTTVLWCTQLAEGWHHSDRLPWVVAGGGGYFKTGRWIKLSRGTKDQGVPHNNILVSMANAMDIPIDRFGNQACTGPLSELRG